MSISQTLEVAIGLVLVYYILGSIVSWITQMLLEAQQTRGKVLEDYLRKIAGDKTVDLTNLPQVKALQPIRYKNFMGVFGANTEAKKIEKIPVATLVDAFFDISGLTSPTSVDAAELKNVIGALPESEGKAAMLKWIDQGVDSVNGLRTRTNTYFTGILDQAAAKFKANARSFVIVLSILITLILGTDSIQLAKDLWTNAELRVVTAGQADLLVQQGGQLNIDQIIAELDALSIVKLTWWQVWSALPSDATALDWLGFLALKFLGLGLTALAVSQGSSFWYDLLKKLTRSGAGSGGGEEAKG
jgi:hypothetical protein